MKSSHNVYMNFQNINSHRSSFNRFFNKITPAKYGSQGFETKNYLRKLFPLVSVYVFHPPPLNTPPLALGIQ